MQLVINSVGGVSESLGEASIVAPCFVGDQHVGAHGHCDWQQDEFRWPVKDDSP